MGTSGRLILSAHLDDAVLSCWHALHGPLPTTVATVFAGIPERTVPVGSWDVACGVSDARSLVSARRIEDASVLGSHGATAVHLDFLEDQYRAGPVPAQAIYEAVLELACAHQEVWIPAAIGAHPDHRHTAEIALAATADCPERYLYADLPYATHNPDLRAALLTVTDTVDAHATVLASSPFVPIDGLPHARELGSEELRAKLAAVRGYESQLPGLRAAFGASLFEGGLLAQEFTWELEASQRPSCPIDALPLGREHAVRAESPPVPTTFLTVLVRTQARRLQALGETLASLGAQCCQDFEVVVLCHDITESERRDVEAVVATSPATIGPRARIVSVRGGTRARPLNVGASLAAGHYIAVLDDDDLVLPDWVSRFQALAAREPGRVLRSPVALASRDADSWRVTATFPAEFDYIDHLLGNRSPVCGLAFPRRCIDELGLEFNEQLSVLEDWDFMLRATQLLGVATSSTPTAIYRRWDAGDDSRAVHGAATFQVAERRILDSIDQVPLLLPPGSAAAVRQERLARLGLDADRDALKDRLRELDARASAELAALRIAHDRAEASLRAELQAARDHAQMVIEEYRTSTSWRVTAPLRAAGSAWLRLRRAPENGRGGTAESPAAAHPAVDASTWPPSYFDALYEEDPDPWSYATRWYERRKYSLTLALLPEERYRRAFEPGCSIGVLTAGLAARCAELVAVDCAEAAVRSARRRVGALPHVQVARLTVPQEWPEGRFDLIVLSELAAYFDDEDVSRFLERMRGSLAPGGHLVAVHYRPWGGTPQTADDLHARLRSAPGLAAIASYQEASFLADVLVRSSDGG